MYASFIRSRTRRAFEDLSAGRVGQHIERFHDKAILRLDRDGRVKTFRGRAVIHEALEGEFSPPRSHSFKIKEIFVRGWPHCTRIAVLWSDKPNGDAGDRMGMNVIVLHWGKVIEEYVFAGAHAES